MLLKNNSKNVIDLIKMYERLNNQKKLMLLIHLFEKLDFKTVYEIEGIIDILKFVLNNLNQYCDKTIINFSKNKDLLFMSSKYLELNEIEKKNFTIEMLFNIYETDFLDTKINKFINEKLSVYEYYYAIL